MKRFFAFLTAAIAAVGISSAAQAFSVPVGEWNAHFSDFTSLYRNGVALDPGVLAAPNDWFKAQINLDQVIPKGGGLPVWSPSATDQVAGLEYNFVVLNVVPTFDILGNLQSGKLWAGVPTVGSTGPSTIDLYNRNPYVWNTGAGFAPQTGPMDPNMNPGTPGAPGTVSGINDAGSSLLLSLNAIAHPDQCSALIGGCATLGITTLVYDFNFSTGTGSGDMYADAVGGSFLSQIEHQILGPAQLPSDFYLKFSSNLNSPLYGWGTRSEDPAEFSTVPEPSTMMLMGSGILGLAGYGFARRRNKE